MTYALLIFIEGGSKLTSITGPLEDERDGEVEWAELLATGECDDAIHTHEIVELIPPEYV